MLSQSFRALKLYGREPEDFAAIDAMFDKLDRQVQKYKQKMQDHHRGDKVANHVVV